MVVKLIAWVAGLSAKDQQWIPSCSVSELTPGKFANEEVDSRKGWLNSHGRQTKCSRVMHICEDCVSEQSWCL